ncbi:MAG: hypothetical protein A2138_26910 [Deltaproteobacteria bacterium RBG_16_71_12]|nr:MAG: hypothetical protein A2138_26910 [Deltaproteobacteria bacterium RBG_16_71_12]
MAEQVRIAAERPVDLPASPGTAKRMIMITYVAYDMPPRIVYVDGENDTPEERARVISEDLEVARSSKPPTLNLP